MSSRIVACLLVCLVMMGVANAQTRDALIAELIRAQGLQTVLDDTLQESTNIARQYGRDVLSKMLGDASNLPAEKRERVEAVFQQYIDRCATMWTSAELIALYTNSYGADLADTDLSEMLAYYKSPVGTKDVAATRLANRTYVAAMTAESRRRLQQLIKEFIDSLKSELGK